MSTAAERQQRADESDAAYAVRQQKAKDRAVLVQACADALTDIRSAPVLRVRAFIREVSDPDNPNELLRKAAEGWLKMTDLLLKEAGRIVRDAQPPTDNRPPPETP